MNKKHTFKKAAALMLGLALTVGATGCNFFPTDSEKDLAQTVASVNISANIESEFESVKDSLNTLMGNAEIKKRDLVAYFLSTGYMYVDQYGYTYEQTFNMLLDWLESREIMLQHVVAYYLKKTGANATTINAYIDNEIAKMDASAALKDTLKKEYRKLFLYKYFLTENNASTEEYDRAIYNLKKSINDALDSTEQSYIVASGEAHDHGETRTMPTNATTKKTDYYTTSYDVYTGRDALSSNNTYKTVEGSTPVTRKKAYNAFLANLQGYNLIEAEEDTSRIENLEYYYVELTSTLGQALLNKYNEAKEQEAIADLNEAYVTAKYEKILEQQKQAYENDYTAYSSAIDALSNDSFMLYGKQKSETEKFGFVYNILLPFSASQNVAYSEAKNRGLAQDDLYKVRKGLLENIQAKDLRTSWISEHDHADYSYWKEGKLYFFEDNFAGNGEYEKLSQYAGQYPFNGTVSEDKSEVKSDTVDIDQFIKIFEDYISEVSGCEIVNEGKKVNYNADTYYKEENGKKVVDYSKFLYYQGKVDLGEVASADFFKADTNAYKALSAVNELMFAYSTDTGCLNKYMGYSVSPYGTNFVKEFEYAAQQAVNGGVGSYTVCATDFGWHIVYTSFVFDANNPLGAYGGYIDDEKEVEGTFSNLFYESLKSTAISNYTAEEESRVLTLYGDSVTRYQDRYQDLLDLDKTNA